MKKSLLVVVILAALATGASAWSGGGWGSNTFDLYGIPLGTSLQAPGDGTSPVYQASSKSYIAGTAGGGVTGVTAGAGIAVTGPAGSPTISNSGILGINAGTNVTLSGPSNNPTVSATAGGGGVSSVTAGAGISVGTSGGTVTVTNTSSVNAGTNITVTGPSTNPTVTAASPIAGTGISVSGTTVTNTGIIALVAGTGIGVSGSTITNTGIVALVAGAGIGVSGSTISNTGVTGINAGTNITLTGPSTNPTVSAPAYGTTAGTVLQGNDRSPPLDTWAATTDVTTLNSSTSAHGLLPKLDNNANHDLDGTGAWVVPYVTTTATFVIPAINSTVNVTVSKLGQFVAGGSLQIYGGANGMNALINGISGLVMTVVNVGLVGGTVGATMPSGAIVTSGFGAYTALGTASQVLVGGAAIPTFGNVPIAAVPTGQTGSTVPLGNDTRFPPAPSGAGKIIYDNGTNYVELAAGTSSQVLTGGTTPAWASFVSSIVAGTNVTISGGTGAVTINAVPKFRIALMPGAAEVTGAASDPVLFGQRGTNSNWSELQYDASTLMQARWVVGGSIVNDYAGGAITLRIRWYATATTGNVIWTVKSLSRAAGTVMDGAYDSTNAHTSTVAAAGTTLQITNTDITWTPIAGELTAGSLYMVQVERTANAGGDTMAGNANVVSVTITEN